MRLIRDIAATAGDVLRLSGDLVRYKMEMEKKLIKRIVGRVVASVAILLGSAIVAGVGAGFMLYGVFVLLAEAMSSPAAAGLILGFVLLLLAVAAAIMARSILGRS